MPKGRKNSSISPPARLLSEPCSARPMATPAEPKSVMNAEPGMPSTSDAVTSTAMRSTSVDDVEIKLATLGSMRLSSFSF